LQQASKSGHVLKITSRPQCFGIPTAPDFGILECQLPPQTTEIRADSRSEQRGGGAPPESLLQPRGNVVRKLLIGPDLEFDFSVFKNNHIGEYPRILTSQFRVRNVQQIIIIPTLRLRDPEMANTDICDATGAPAAQRSQGRHGGDLVRTTVHGKQMSNRSQIHF